MVISTTLLFCRFSFFSYRAQFQRVFPIFVLLKDGNSPVSDCSADISSLRYLPRLPSSLPLDSFDASYFI